MIGRLQTTNLRSKGREIRSWPLLALLILVVFVGAACVLWFMLEASQNERLAVRQRLADAYRGHLTLVQTRLEAQWQKRLTTFDDAPAGPAAFARWVQEGLAESMVSLSEQGLPIYPQDTTSGQGELTEMDRSALALQSEIRSLAQAGDGETAINLVTDRFGRDEFQRARDEQGRIIAANAELLALELMRNPSHPRFAEVADRVKQRALRYEDSSMPAGQRRFLMRELRRLQPDASFPTFPAEDLAARYLNAPFVMPRPIILIPGDAGDIWHTASPGRRAVALFTTSGLRHLLQESLNHQVLPQATTVAVLMPGEEPPGNPADPLLTAQAGDSFPGFRLTLTLDDRSIFETASDRKVTTYLWIGSLVVAAMLALAAIIVRAFGQQVRLTQLKNDLVATVSHELKTPLTSMRALVDTLLDAEHFDETATREYLQLIAQENARLSRLIDNFLTFSRLDRGKFTFHFEPIAPQAVIDSTAGSLGDRFRASGCHLEVVTAPDLPLINGDRDALVTALLNLLDNAWKYTGDEKHIALRTTAEKGTVRFTVEDNGVGLSARETHHIFGQFYQVDQRLSRRTEGCGLGLSIVQRIATAHGGEITVTSDPGRGSTFTIEIPTARKGAT